MKRDHELERLIEEVGRENNWNAVLRWGIAGAVVIWWLLS